MDPINRRISQLSRERLEQITRLALWTSFSEGLVLAILAFLMAMD